MGDRENVAVLGEERPPPAAGAAGAAPAGAPPGTHGGTAAGLLAVPAGLVRTARPRQWVKNLLVLAAPAAAGELDSPRVLAELAAVLVVFVCASSAVYLVNDARDAKADRAHPAKCRRPVASGQVPVAVAYGTGAVLAVLAPAAAALLCNAATAAAVGGYVVLQLAYCMALKQVLVVDLAVVASGFLVRAVAGGFAAGVPLSRWFLVTAGFGALFMVSAKRYSELVALAGLSGETRPLLTSYTPGYLRFVWQLAAGGMVLAYCLWALEGGAPAGGEPVPWRQLSVVPFLLAVLRYAVFADRAGAGSPEDIVLRDRPLLCTALAWTVLYGLAVAGV
ncbi:decaprenyl-phosphate phosphoribosyltransferase [Streptomyces thermolineatus]|uniref:Decaprenyl-phosphate phosphoribosyltransferase n=1 Tax=Streptomyces thermolineatus TaxID=44033 RepID=A0ABN3KPE8_9ACTN